MNSLRLYGKKKSDIRYSGLELRFEFTPKPHARSNEVLLKVAYCGLCGSDFHLTNSTTGIMDYPGLVKLPITIGHEFSATVEEYGQNVPQYFRDQNPIGSAVTAEEMLWCGKCENCQRGNVNHCLYLEEIGFTHNGAHSEYLCVPFQYLHSIEPILKKYGKEKGLQIGALIEPFSVAYRALHYAGTGLKLGPNHSVLVIGAGPIGIAVAEIAKRFTNKEVTVLEIIDERKKFAAKRKLHAYCSTEEIKNKKFDWIIDAAGSAITLQSAIIKNTNASATICLLARCDNSLNLSTDLMITKNLKVFGAQGHSGDDTYPAVIHLFCEGSLDIESIIEDVISLEEAHKRLTKQLRGYGKILVNPRINNHA